jgi:hypothetical protein
MTVVLTYNSKTKAMQSEVDFRLTTFLDDDQFPERLPGFYRLREHDGRLSKSKFRVSVTEIRAACEHLNKRGWVDVTHHPSKK